MKRPWVGILAWVVGAGAGMFAGTGPDIRLADAEELQRFEFSQRHMGTVFRLVFYALDREVANEGAEAAFRRVAELNAIFSDYDSDSEMMRLSANPAAYGENSPGIRVSRDLWQVLTASQTLSRQSNGAFDITVGPLTKLWRRARRQHVLPATAALAAARASVGHQHVELVDTSQAVRFRGDVDESSIRMDAGGIAKGYAADAALAELRQHGIERALIDAGGDLRLGVAPPGHAGWRVGVVATTPPEQDMPSFHLLLEDCGVATSGDLWQYIEIDGRRYSHIVDPRTGLGLTNRIAVTVVAADGMTADGLASAVSVLGAEAGVQLLNTLSGATGRIVAIEDGQPVVAAANGFGDLRQVP